MPISEGMISKYKGIQIQPGREFAHAHKQDDELQIPPWKAAEVEHDFKQGPCLEGRTLRWNFQKGDKTQDRNFQRLPVRRYGSKPRSPAAAVRKEREIYRERYSDDGRRINEGDVRRYRGEIPDSREGELRNQTDCKKT